MYHFDTFIWDIGFFSQLLIKQTNEKNNGAVLEYCIVKAPKAPSATYLTVDTRPVSTIASKSGLAPLKKQLLLFYISIL